MSNNSIYNILNQTCDSNANFIADEQIRQAATEFCKAENIPTKKHEEWRNINLKLIFESNYQAQSIATINNETIAKLKILDLTANILIFIDSNFSPEYSEIISPPSKITAECISTAKEKNPDLISKLNNSTGIYSDNIFTGLNAIHSTTGYFIEILPQNIVEEPIHIINITTGNNPIIQQKNIISIGKNSQVKIIESYHSISKNKTFTNIATEIIANENSNIDLYRLQQQNDNDFQINSTKTIQQQNSNFSCNMFTLGGSIIKNDIKIDVQGKNCQTEINGLYLPKGKQHFDNYTYINHAKPHCKSSQIFKGIATDKATSSYYGLIYVAKNAQKIDAYQSNKNILLTDTAKAHSRPQLEIHADDVKCSHGSTTGQLDQEALFYLQTRGLNRKKATALLLSAFAADIVEKIKIEPLHNMINKLKLMIENS